MWLVRTAQNEIAGPYTVEQIKQLVGGGQLTLQDENCPANGYWIFLHGKEEVLKLLGLQFPRAGIDESTETQTETLTETETETETTPADGSPDDAPFPDLQDVGGTSTAMISNRALRRFFPKKDQQPSGV